MIHTQGGPYFKQLLEQEIGNRLHESILQKTSVLSSKSVSPSDSVFLTTQITKFAQVR